MIRFEKYLADKGLLSEKKRGRIEAEVLDEIQAAVDRAEKQMEPLGDPLEMFDHAYADMPPYLEKQKEDFARELSNTDEEGKHG